MKLKIDTSQGLTTHSQQQTENEQIQTKPLAGTIQKKEGEGFERPLSDSEIKYAQEIFGESLDYSVIRITRHNLASTGASKTIGNTIHLQDKDGYGFTVFAKDGRNLTERGRQLLIHEMTHVWQYQNGGWKYVPDSLLSQLYAQITTGNRGGAYDWEEPHDKKIPWEQWNPEQQASAVEEYNVRLRNIRYGSHRLEDFQTLEVLKPYIDLVQRGEGAPKFPSPPKPPTFNVPKIPIPSIRRPRIPKFLNPTGIPDID